MSLLKRHTGRRRHVGRRAAGVAVGVALIVLGLEAPAFAVTPTVTAFTPTSGPGATATGSCVLVITGTNFNNPTASDVRIGGDNTGDFAVISDTEIWATVPAGAGSGSVQVTNASGTGSLDGFVRADTGGGCVPTITSFTPTCGPGGTDVTITGTNLLRGTSGGAGVAGHVRFAPYAATGDANQISATPTELVVDVPNNAAGTQPIRIDTFNTTVGEGRVFSATQFAAGTCITDFQPQSGDAGATVTITGIGFEDVSGVQFTGTSGPVVALFTLTTDTETTDVITTTVPVGAITGPITLLTPDAPNGTSVQTADFTVGPVQPTTHERNVTLKLSGALRMKGKVKVPDGTTECFSGVSVKLQRKKKGGGWKTLKTVTTNDTGAYSGKVKNRPGKYRSVAPKLTLSDDSVCLKDASPVRKN